jgi:hypothetical protein
MKGEGFINLSHLLFADDVMIFVSYMVNEVHNFKVILDLYLNSLGRKLVSTNPSLFLMTWRVE